MSNWFIGRSQQDPGEPDTFDGTVWEPPSRGEQDAEARGEGEAEPYLIAEHIRHEPYARLIAAAPDLLAACEAAIEQHRAHHVARGENEDAAFAPGAREIYQAMKAAVAKAKGGAP